MLSRILRLVLGLTIAVLAASPAHPATAVSAAAVPAGFTDTLVASVGAPTALAFTPDGRLLIATQPGRLRVYQSGSLLSTPAIDFTNQWPGGSRICSNFERGLLGVAVDPNFLVNNYIYLYYTFNKDYTCPNSTVVNRVSRLAMSGNTVLTTTESVLVDNIPSTNGNHNAGDVQFGADGLLYISAGDAGTGGSNARTLSNLAGKILRIGADGSIPAGNPYAGDAASRRCGDPSGVPAGSGPCKEIIAHGLRNPFRFAFRPGTSQFYLNDVGQNTWEEIDVGQIGADYGWNCREGAHPYTACNPPATNPVDPIFEYRHGVQIPGTTSPTNCNSLGGGVFVPDDVWTAPGYNGAYLFSDYVCGVIVRLTPDGGGGYTASDFASGLGSPVHLVFGPYNGTQALYYSAYGSGQVRRIAYTLTQWVWLPFVSK